MIDIALVLILFCAFVGISFFHNALVPGLFVILLSGALLVLRFLISHGKLVLKKERLVLGGLALVLVVSFGFQHMKYVENGFLNYQHLLQKFDEFLEEELPEDAQAVLDEAAEIYGADKNSQHIRKAQLAIYLDRYEEAEEYLNLFNHKDLKEYYLLLEEVYNNLGKIDELNQMYIEAADVHPEWEYVWSKAGIVHLEQGNYQAAHYYLKQAYEIAGNDGMAPYRLGLLYYAVGEDLACMECFAEALNRGVSDETKASMVSYLEEMGVTWNEK